MLIQYAKVKEAEGKYPLSVTNTYNVTNISFNDNLGTINDFVKRIPKDSMVALSSQHSSHSMLWSQNSATSHQSPYQKFISKSAVLPLCDILKLPTTTFCATVATTNKLIASKYGWYYQACHECPCVVKGDIPPYICTKGHSTETAIYRYKIEIEVLHGGTKCKFVLWDKESEQLLKVPAGHMRDTMIENGIYDPLEFPLTLDTMLDLEIAFRIKWQPDWKNCSVVSMTQDKTVIDNLKSTGEFDKDLVSQPCTTPSLHIKESVDEAVAVDLLDANMDLEITSKHMPVPATPIREPNCSDPSTDSATATVTGLCDGEESSTKVKKVANCSKKTLKVDKKPMKVDKKVIKKEKN